MSDKAAPRRYPWPINLDPFDARYPHASVMPVPYGCKILNPGERCTFSGDFQRPFRLVTFEAKSENAEGIVVEDILVEKRSLLVSANVIPIEAFFQDHLPIRFGDRREIQIHDRLMLVVKNTSAEPRTLEVDVLGVVFNDVTDHAHSKEHWIWKFLVAPALKLYRLLRNWWST